jgi:hypothetical protein
MRGITELSAEERSALQRAGREWVEQHFNLARTVQQYGELYRELIA